MSRQAAPSPRESVRALVTEALGRGDFPEAALQGQLLARLEPPFADDLALAAITRLMVSDRAGAQRLLEQALSSDSRHALSAKVMAKLGPLPDEAVAALAWHAEADPEARDLLCAGVATSGRPIGFIAGRAIHCALPARGGRLRLIWQNLTLADQPVPAADQMRLLALPLPEALRGIADAELQLDDVPVLAPHLQGSWLRPPRLLARVDWQANGEGLDVRVLDQACPERPLAILLADDDKVLARHVAVPPTDRFIRDVTKVVPLTVAVPPGLSRPRLFFELTAEPLPVPLPEADRWSAPADPAVDVIVPVYGDFTATEACFTALLSCDGGVPMRVIAIDDVGPDPRIGQLLARLAGEGRIVLQRNPANLGFVRSVNIGMAMHVARDVVLLNADTEVAPGWLRRLRDAAWREADVGTVTPWSNDATICSYPAANAPTPLDDVDVRQLNALAGTSLAGRTLEIPTAVGFCMYIRRDCLRQTGWFDAETFGTGYGEENDFCLRASILGWRHLMALDAYVGHVGGGSFGASKQARVDEALALLARRYPAYEPAVHGFIEADPLIPHRRTLDRARLFASQSAPRPLLVVCARLGGGTDRFIQSMLEKRPGGGDEALLLRPARPEGRPARLVIEVPGRPDLGNLIYDPLLELDLLLADISRLGVVEMELHHPYHLLPETLARLTGLFPYRMHLHDYGWICPRITLTDGDDQYCGEPEVAACEQCVRIHEDLLRIDMPVARWREQARRVLEGAVSVGCATQEAVTRMRRYAPGAHYAVAGLEDGVYPVPVGRRAAGETLRVVVPGAIGPPKGFAVLLACARDAAARNLPLRFLVMGYSLDDSVLGETGHVVVTGRYEEAEVGDLLRELRPHAAFVPSVWPETWCYALSHVMAAGLPVACFDLGAQAERLRALGQGMLLPPGLSASAINDRLLALVPVAG